jgi:hypothetical protein
MVNANNPLWNLNELCNNWMVFVVFVGFLAAAGIYQHYRCVKINNGAKFKDDKEINGMYIGICACAAVAGLLIISGFMQYSNSESLTVS